MSDTNKTLADLSENIGEHISENTVVIGRFLEHTRVY